MRGKFVTLSWAAAFLLVAGLVVSAMAADKAGHPELTAEEKLVPCFECHKKATPEVQQQWYDSVHGIAMIKCYMCHGTFENFQVTPAVSTCATCHEAMIDKCPKDKKCWECHTPHVFKASK